jgi:hypothetical protein
LTCWSPSDQVPNTEEGCTSSETPRRGVPAATPNAAAVASLSVRSGREIVGRVHSPALTDTSIPAILSRERVARRCEKRTSASCDRVVIGDPYRLSMQRLSGGRSSRPTWCADDHCNTEYNPCDTVPASLVFLHCSLLDSRSDSWSFMRDDARGVESVTKNSDVGQGCQRVRWARMGPSHLVRVAARRLLVLARLSCP